MERKEEFTHVDRDTNTAKTPTRLTQLSDLSVEGAADRSAMEGQPGETVMAHRVTTQQKTRDLIPLQGEHILADTTLQHLQNNTQPDGVFCFFFKVKTQSR